MVCERTGARLGGGRDRDGHGFFLMVDGSQIDRAGHENNHSNVVAETVDFDDAVGIGINGAFVCNRSRQ